MKIYVAAKFEEKERVREAYAKLRERGHTITHDWTNESSDGMSGETLHEYLNRCATADVDGVATCDALVVFPHDHGKGLFVELGIALALHKTVIAVGNNECNCIFLRMKGIRWMSSIDAVCALLEE